MEDVFSPVEYGTDCESSDGSDSGEEKLDVEVSS